MLPLALVGVRTRHLFRHGPVYGSQPGACQLRISGKKLWAGFDRGRGMTDGCSAQCSRSGFGNPTDVTAARERRARSSQLMKFTFPLFRSYIAPTILIFPPFSRSARIGLLLRIAPMVYR